MSNIKITASTLAVMLEWVIKNNPKLKGKAIVEEILRQYDQQLLKNHDT